MSLNIVNTSTKLAFRSICSSIDLRILKLLQREYSNASTRAIFNKTSIIMLCSTSIISDALCSTNIKFTLTKILWLFVVVKRARQEFFITTHFGLIIDLLNFIVFTWIVLKLIIWLLLLRRIMQKGANIALTSLLNLIDLSYTKFIS